MKNERIRQLVLIALLAAMAYIAVFVVRIPVVAFLKYEPKDVIITIGGFLLGPMGALLVCFLVALLEMVTISETGIIGCIMNFLSSACFACAAALIYKRSRRLRGAIVGLIIGSVAMIGVMLLWNWLITPLYMGVSRSAVEGMLIPVFLPFNALKAGLNSALVLGLYKPLATALRKIRLAPERAGGSGSSRWGVYLLAAGLFITCIVLLLVLRGIL